METTMTFTVASLLSMKNGNISGPMSPMLTAKEMAKQMDCKFNRLARLWFNDERINQFREDGGLTGFDTLIIGTVYKNDVWLTLWVDMGYKAMPIAMAFRSDTEVSVTPLYRKGPFARKLRDDEIRQIFGFLFENVQQLDIRQEEV